jgi:hypothetical protein
MYGSKAKAFEALSWVRVREAHTRIYGYVKMKPQVGVMRYRYNIDA